MRLSCSAAVAAVALTSIASLCATDASAANVARTYVSGTYALVVDNQPAGTVKEAAGGSPYAEVVTEGAPSGYAKKRLGPVKYEPITLAVSDFTPPLASWISATVNRGVPQAKGGAFSAIDGAGRESVRTTWTDGYLDEVTFPELDASDKSQAKIALSIVPQRTTTTFGGGAAPARATKGGGRSGLVSNFRMTIPGLDTSRVAHVDPITVSFEGGAGGIGAMREPSKSSQRVRISNLVFSVPEASAQPFYAWHTAFVVQGKNGDDQEKTATIELLAPNGSTRIYRLTLGHVGPVKVGPDPSSSEQARRVRVECYVESASVEFL